MKIFFSTSKQLTSTVFKEKRKLKAHVCFEQDLSLSPLIFHSAPEYEVLILRFFSIDLAC